MAGKVLIWRCIRRISPGEIASQDRDYYALNKEETTRKHQLRYLWNAYLVLHMYVRAMS